MADIVGTITEIEDYLTPEDISLKILDSTGQEIKIELFADRVFCIPAFQRELRWSTDNVNTLLADVSRGAPFLGNIILSTDASHKCVIIDGQQRTTVCYLIISYIRKKFQDRLEIPSLCPIDNKSFSGLQKIIEQGFERTTITQQEWDELLSSDMYSQFPRYNEIWNVLKTSELLNKVGTARTVLKNILASKVNIIVSYSDPDSSIPFFLDVNLKGVRLDTEDIFKGYLFSQDSREEIRSLWQENKALAIRFNHVKGRNNEKLYPLMKIYEHFLRCDLYTSTWGKANASEIKFGESFELAESVEVEGEQYFKGSHIIEVINSRDYIYNALQSIKRCLTLMIDIVESTGPSDSFKQLFRCSEGDRIDDNDKKNCHGMLQKILLDKEVVPKVLVLKYIVAFLDGEEHQKKCYKSFYSVFMAAVLFSALASKKKSADFFDIVSKEQWVSSINKWTYEFVASVEITKGKLLAAYKYTDEDDEYQRYRCKSFAAVCNYFTAKKRQTDYCISVSSSSALGEFLSNAHQFSIEHLIISESGTLDIRTSNYDFQYRYPSTIKKYRNSLFNYIFIPQEINRDMGNGLLRDKLEVIQKEIEHISCNYSKHFCSMIVSNPQKYFASYPTQESLEQFANEDQAQNYLDHYFTEVFPNEILRFASDFLSELNLTS